MELHYVGAKPIVDQHGVGFDKSEPDRYIFIQAVLELMKSIEACHEASCGSVVDITREHQKQPTRHELLEQVKRECGEQIEEIAKERQKRLDALVSKYKEDVHANRLLNTDEKEAWLGNIDVMEAYYRQFVQNEIVYECLLERLADRLYEKKIEEILFYLGNNYGFVFSYLQGVLAEHKPPLDVDMRIETKDGKTIGRFFIRYPKKADI